MRAKLEEVVYAPSSRKTKPNKIMREEILPFFKENNVKTILDYGCGRFLRDSLFLTENGFAVDAVDLEEQVRNIKPEKSKLINSLSTEIPDNNYDASLLNFVIQVLPTEKQRQEERRKLQRQRILEEEKRQGNVEMSSRRHDYGTSRKNCGAGFILKVGVRSGSIVLGCHRARLCSVLFLVRMIVLCNYFVHVYCIFLLHVCVGTRR